MCTPTVKMKENTSDSSAERAEKEMEPEVLLMVENQIKMKSEPLNKRPKDLKPTSLSAWQLNPDWFILNPGFLLSARKLYAI